MNAVSDQDLIIDFQKGRSTAFNELVLRYQERIYWIARRIVNDHDTADDIVQEVFIKVHSELKNFRGDSQFYTWLYRITVNRAINIIRKKRIREFLRLDNVADIIKDSEYQPDERYECNENEELIEKAIQALPEKQRIVFLLRYQEELTYEEISKILKTSVGGLKANYFHAIKKITEYVRKAHSTY